MYRFVKNKIRIVLLVFSFLVGIAGVFSITEPKYYFSDTMTLTSLLFIFYMPKMLNKHSNYISKNVTEKECVSRNEACRVY
jgi:hypothetical protein